ncbi:MAG: hypothetical protein J5877_05305 [Clostridia bacterium]|nr:hypothetical protein [Clostridia bacterium]
MIKYFLGANTPGGFYSLFDELYFPHYDGRLFVIKGGPGTGKSSVMKRVADEAEKRGFEVERIFCSSDSSSLDGVIIPELKTAVADGTPPHIIEPKYPGAVEQIVNLGDCWDAGFLRINKENIIEKSFECSAYHKRCVRFLKAYEALENDSRRLVEPAVDVKKLSDYAERLSIRLFPFDGGKKQGRVTRRFLSAVTNEGITVFEESVKTLCDRVYSFGDEYGVCSNLFMGYILKAALRSGFDAVVCPCVTNPKRKIDHVIIPEKRLCFVSENSFHSFDVEKEKTVSANRFTDTAVMKKHSARLGFNRRASSELLDEAALSLTNAKTVHDELEEYYISAMDFSFVRKKAQKLIDEIFD